MIYRIKTKQNTLVDYSIEANSIEEALESLVHNDPQIAEEFITNIDVIGIEESA